MDEIVKGLFTNSPQLALMAFMLWTVYNDGKAERAKMLDLLQKQSEQLDDMKERLVRLEVAEFGERFPTNAKRPEQTGVGN